MRNKLPIYPMVCLYCNNAFTHSENALLRIINSISLTHTPATKLNPPSLPLFKLCLMMVKITGPTDKARILPSANPFSNASIMCKFRNVKILVPVTFGRNFINSSIYKRHDCLVIDQHCTGYSENCTCKDEN